LLVVPTHYKVEQIPLDYSVFFDSAVHFFLGSAVPLPQRAPYTDPLQILICGGSTNGAGQAVDNCVTIAPEAANPKWTLERMVRILFLNSRKE